MEVGTAVIVRPAYLSWRIKLPGVVVRIDDLGVEGDRAQIVEIKLLLEDEPRMCFMRTWDMEDWGPWVEVDADIDLAPSASEEAFLDTHIEERL